MPATSLSGLSGSHQWPLYSKESDRVHFSLFGAMRYGPYGRLQRISDAFLKVIFRPPKPSRSTFGILRPGGRKGKGKSGQGSGAWIDDVRLAIERQGASPGSAGGPDFRVNHVSGQTSGWYNGCIYVKELYEQNPPSRRQTTEHRLGIFGSWRNARRPLRKSHPRRG